MPKTAWRLYAGKSLAPIRRKILGYYVPEDDTARKTLWQALPETTRAMVRAAALKAIDAAQATERERTAHDELARNGIAITRLTPAGFAAFRAQVDPVYAEWTPKIGAELVDAVRKAAASAPEAPEKAASGNAAAPAK